MAPVTSMEDVTNEMEGLDVTNTMKTLEGDSNLLNGSSSSNRTVSSNGNASSKQQQSSSSHRSALEWKEEGNRAFSNKNYQQALDAYDRGLKLLENEEQQPKDDSAVLLLSMILSNRAMTLIKLKDFVAAEETCNRFLLLQPIQQQQPRYKVLYHRAIARENRAIILSSQSKKQGEILISLAISDLRESLQDLDQHPNMNERKSFYNPIAEASHRIQKIQKNLLQQNNISNNNNKMEQQQQQQKPAKTQQQDKSVSSSLLLQDKPSSSSSPPHNHHPIYKKQKQDIMRLLLSRQGGLPKSEPAIEGEAFFLLNYPWWTKFCACVDLFGSNRQIQSKTLSYFPIGTCLPDLASTTTTNNSKATNRDKQLVMNGNDELEHHRNLLDSPGPIDNNNLFLFPQKIIYNNKNNNRQQQQEKDTKQEHYEQWYAPSDELPGGEILPALKPNLVRGYHYEIIPREVYNALREWYGEVTPSVWRRVYKHPQTGQVTVPLYIFSSGISPKTPNSYHCCGACQAPLNVTLRCRRCMQVYYCGRACQENHWAFHKPDCRAVASPNATAPQQSLDLTIQRSHGNVGLNNLGNTCFMNSALQCLSHATPLTRQFLSGKFRQDINTLNPLGSGGKLAMAYEMVMKELWMRSGGGKSFSPNVLKRAIAQFAPRFAGFLQHDAQEFLAYLLDGLHEDLNRIRQAPYVEMPDVQEGQDMAVAGARAWDAHKRRNDSLVMDSFYGQFKSTCVCPQCQKVSVSFDAFNHVSLEIPQLQNSMVTTLLVHVVRKPTLEQAGSPVTRYGVTVRRNNTISEIQQELFKMTGISMNRWHVCECVGPHLSHIYESRELISRLKPNECLLMAYEADPLQEDDKNPFFHAIVQHKIVSRQKSASSEANENHVEETFWGVPLLLSWPATATCRQIWELLWISVQDKVDEGVRDRYRQTIEFRLMDVRGKPAAVFPEWMAPPQDGTAYNERTSWIPRHLDETLVSFLGEDAVESYWSVFAEWTDLEETKENSQGSRTNGALDEDRFLVVVNHPSWIDAAAKRYAQNATKGVSLEQCFDTFVKPERLDERNMWYCSGCKEHVRAMKTMELWRLPNILVVHLKRFEFKNVLRRDKLDTLVQFPLDGLNMRAHCGRSGYGLVDETVPAEYDLFAVINHYGRMGFGHYTAFARNWNEREISNDWFLFDDSRVQLVQESIVSNAAYVLFYRRRTWH